VRALPQAGALASRREKHVRKLFWSVAAMALGATTWLSPTTPAAAAATPIERTYSASGTTSTGQLYGRGFYQGLVNVPGNVMMIDACDLLADDMRVVVWVYNSSRSYKVEDANGSGNGCKRLDDVPHLIVGTIKVCRQKGSTGTPRDCAYSSFDYSYFWET
jgi:hypothetical protein